MAGVLVGGLGHWGIGVGGVASGRSGLSRRGQPQDGVDAEWDAQFRECAEVLGESGKCGEPSGW